MVVVTQHTPMLDKISGKRTSQTTLHAFLPKSNNYQYSHTHWSDGLRDFHASKPLNSTTALPSKTN